MVPDSLAREIEALQDAGKTCVLIGEIGEKPSRILGALAIADVLREDARAVVHALKVIGVRRVVMLTGDNSRVAAAIAQQAGVDEFHAECSVARYLRKFSHVNCDGSFGAEI